MKLLGTSCMLAIFALGVPELHALEKDRQPALIDRPVIDSFAEIRERLLADEHQERETPTTVGQWGNWQNYWND